MKVTQPLQSAFLAAPHAADFASMLDAIERTLSAHGYKALRLSYRQKTEVIPALLSRVRKVDLVVAVLTGSRPNVYFELGVALGASVPAIVIAESVADLGMLSGFADVILYGSGPEDVGPQLDRLIELRKSAAHATALA